MNNQSEEQILRREAKKIMRQVIIGAVITIVMAILQFLKVLPFLQYVTAFCGLYTLVMVGTWLNLTLRIHRN
ncbi:hypothetical protein [Limosilactobacillus difficilis]|uniref:hypothetical protein n=1 Tax=Limosilactobacillus difficilis TaxID=2991838 RepID=UPI0024B88506|nr:hypothetical protein [Limosilactobacillus difficilis]